MKLMLNLFFNAYMYVWYIIYLNFILVSMGTARHSRLVDQLELQSAGIPGGLWIQLQMAEMLNVSRTVMRRLR